MKAVFLDTATFLPEVALPKPKGITDYQTYPQTPQDEQLIIERCQSADIIITNKVQLTRSILSQLPNLKLIQLTATGINNVDKEACEDYGITLYNVAGYAVKSVPEHTFMLMLAAMRAGWHYHQAATDGTWQKSGKFCLLDTPLLDLEDKTLGIIGVGTIGRRVSDIAKAFGMKVLWAEHQHKPARNAQYTEFNDVLQQADVISLHCPLTKETKHLINAKTISQMQKKPLIVNVARGDVVDAHAIVRAIENQQILGYASDVFAHEPFADDDPLLSLANHKRVIFSPHNAWGSIAAQEKLWEILCQQVEGFILKTH